MKKKRKSKIGLIILLVLAALLIWFGIWFYNLFSGFYDLEDDVDVIPKKPAGDQVNILLMGIDTFEMEDSRTDTLMVASFNKKTGHAALLSIPRDSRVEIPGRGLDKINHAHAFGGIPLTVETVENFLKIDINYYVRINLQGFENIVDLIGGVEMEIEPAVAEAVWGLQSGYQRLNGTQAVGYVRVRYIDNDFGRIQRQQKFLMAVADQALNSSNILKMPSLLEALGENAKTNIPPFELTSLGNRLLRLQLDEVEQAYITGSDAMINGIYYLIVDEENVQQTLRDLRIKS